MNRGWRLTLLRKAGLAAGSTIARQESRRPRALSGLEAKLLGLSLVADQLDWGQTQSGPHSPEPGTAENGLCRAWSRLVFGPKIKTIA